MGPQIKEPMKGRPRATVGGRARSYGGTQGGPSESSRLPTGEVGIPGVYLSDLCLPTPGRGLPRVVSWLPVGPAWGPTCSPGRGARVFRQQAAAWRGTQ